MQLSFHLLRWPFMTNKTMQLTSDQGVSIEIKSLFSFKGDKRVIMFPLGL